MLYHWAGTRVLADTIVRKKRHMQHAAEDARRYAIDIRRCITPADDALMQDSWQRLAREYYRDFKGVTESERHDVSAKVVWHFLVEQVKFVADERGFDYWQFPEETLVRRSGDCEDKSFLTISLLLAAGVPAERLRVVIGAVVRRRAGGRRRRTLGHAWPIYRAKSGRWCVLETHLRHLPTRSASGDRVLAKRAVGVDRAAFVPVDDCAVDDRPLQYVPFICLNKQTVWAVEQCQRGRVKVALSVAPDWGRNPTFREIWSKERRLETYGLGANAEEEWLG